MDQLPSSRGTRPGVAHHDLDLPSNLLDSSLVRNGDAFEDMLGCRVWRSSGDRSLRGCEVDVSESTWTGSKGVSQALASTL